MVFGFTFLSRKEQPPSLDPPLVSASSSPPPAPSPPTTTSPSPAPFTFPLPPSPPPSEPTALLTLLSSIPAPTLQSYILTALPTASPSTLGTLSTFFNALTPPPSLHCVRCHKSFFDIENTDRSCLIPHDDDSALVERVKGAYETLWGCCGRTVEGDGDMGPPDGWCYEGKHTTDIKRARFRADSTPMDDKLVSCARKRCFASPSTSASRPKRKRERVKEESEDEEEKESVSSSSRKRKPVTTKRRKTKTISKSKEYISSSDAEMEVDIKPQTPPSPPPSSRPPNSTSTNRSTKKPFPTSETRRSASLTRTGTLPVVEIVSRPGSPLRHETTVYVNPPKSSSPASASTFSSPTAPAAAPRKKSISSSMKPSSLRSVTAATEDVFLVAGRKKAGEGKKEGEGEKKKRGRSRKLKDVVDSSVDSERRK